MGFRSVLIALGSLVTMAAATPALACLSPALTVNPGETRENAIRRDQLEHQRRSWRAAHVVYLGRITRVDTPTNCTNTWGERCQRALIRGLVTLNGEGFPGTLTVTDAELCQNGLTEVAGDLVIVYGRRSNWRDRLRGSAWWEAIELLQPDDVRDQQVVSALRAASHR